KNKIKNKQQGGLLLLAYGGTLLKAYKQYPLEFIRSIFGKEHPILPYCLRHSSFRRHIISCPLFLVLE
ncbi:MAG: hypothetical protein JW957_09095, partial [Candidatus Omnitrophica bacterium]|nr:hypothetical protein [Candidatus Omnitrophota bacterium]